MIARTVLKARFRSDAFPISAQSYPIADGIFKAIHKTFESAGWMNLHVQW
jgi:hypothetical protein